MVASTKRNTAPNMSYTTLANSSGDGRKPNSLTISKKADISEQLRLSVKAQTVRNRLNTVADQQTKRAWRSEEKKLSLN